MQSKILYLTILENTSNNYIHQNQILKLEDISVDFFYLFISPFFIIGRNRIGINKNNFYKKKINDIKIPLASYNFSLHIFLLPILVIFSVPVLVFYIARHRPQVVHCRNLLSSFIALFTRKIFFFKYKIISDPRSVYPEEGVIINRWKLNGFNYKIWKKIESFTFKSVESCIGLSDGFTEYLKQFNTNSYFVPALVEENMCFDEEIREKKRKVLKLISNDLVFLYVGSIGLWHDIDTLINMFYGLKQKYKTYNCKIIALSSSEQLKNRLQIEFGNDCLYCSSVSPILVSSYMYLADFGLVPGSNKKGYHYDLLYNTMISSKAEEYICSGLPVICNYRIVELCKYIEANDIGLVYNSETNVFSQNPNKTYNVQERVRISKWGLREFGLKSVMDKLRYIYE